MTKFSPGISGNPGGRPRGAKTTAKLLPLEFITEQDVQAIVASVVAAAKEGDLTAAALVLDRVLPKHAELAREAVLDFDGLLDRTKPARFCEMKSSSSRRCGFLARLSRRWLLHRKSRKCLHIGTKLRENGARKENKC